MTNRQRVTFLLAVQPPTGFQKPPPLPLSLTSDQICLFDSFRSRLLGLDALLRAQILLLEFSSQDPHNLLGLQGFLLNIKPGRQI